MKYDHRVKLNGVWYNAGVEISTPATNTVEKVTKADNSPSLKRSDVQKMKVDELKALATTLGVEFDDETSGNQLKKEILIKLGI